MQATVRYLHRELGCPSTPDPPVASAATPSAQPPREFLDFLKSAGPLLILQIFPGVPGLEITH